MSRWFGIDAHWIEASDGIPEERFTAAELTISIGGKIATRVDDDWSKSVRSNVRLAAYPLALWIASSWWRLRWEPYRADPDLAWRMAHDMPTAGAGFVWPPLRLASDGEGMLCSTLPTPDRPTEPIRYLAQLNETVPVEDVESHLGGFIELVLARLEALGLPKTDLHTLWKDVQSERNDPHVRGERRLEALLGFEPEEAPRALLDHMAELRANVGASALDEIAPACAGPDPAKALEHIRHVAGSAGITARLQILARGDYDGPVWERGWQAAKEARDKVGVPGDIVSNETLCDCLGISTKAFNQLTQERFPIGLAVRGKRSQRLIFRKRNPEGWRFEAARFLAEQAFAPTTDTWLPTTDADTARQKVQRAFAAEFLCPIARLEEFLNGNRSPERVEDAASHFRVSELAIRSHLANHGLLTAGMV